MLSSFIVQKYIGQTILKKLQFALSNQVWSGVIEKYLKLLLQVKYSYLAILEQLAYAFTLYSFVFGGRPGLQCSNLGPVILFGVHSSWTHYGILLFNIQASPESEIIIWDAILNNVYAEYLHPTAETLELAFATRIIVEQSLQVHWFDSIYDFCYHWCPMYLPISTANYNEQYLPSHDWVLSRRLLCNVTTPFAT